MRTTIRLEDALLRRAKAAAADSGRSLNEFISEAVRVALLTRGVQGEVLPIPTFRGRGLQPGVDLDDSAALLDLMERPYGEARKRPAPRVAEKPKPRRR